MNEKDIINGLRDRRSWLLQELKKCDTALEVFGVDPSRVRQRSPRRHVDSNDAMTRIMEWFHAEPRGKVFRKTVAEALSIPNGTTYDAMDALVGQGRLVREENKKQNVHHWLPEPKPETITLRPGEGARANSS
jgi:hypothetical protein